ncbi:MAG: Fe-S oxidoreductase [Rhodospirillales bacterium]|nr:Fe-S oxidoreductase [Rhodospirillales bacterium]
MADIVLINPRFTASYWGLEHALPLMGKKANLPPAGLLLLAALTGGEHHVTIIDENVAPIDYDRCARADLVGLTGMIVQRHRMREILTELKLRGVVTVVGGPWVSVEEAYFGPLADFVFVGEAEDTWPRFLEDWAAGQPASRYEQAERTDMSLVPPPRLDLVDMERYAFGSVQFTRGCPFTCEFCDIIVMFGRRPRLKTAPQIIVELEALRRHNVEVVFIVDDNLIGNRKAIKEVLREVVAWQKHNNYPLTFFTEASIDLADDDEMMQLLVAANVVHVFVGIETPNEASLKETKKLQNVRKGGTLVEKVHRIQEAGLEVWSGMMLGFDNDDSTIFEAQRRFIADARIVSTMIGMIYAIPSTPLHARLRAEGRLDLSDDPTYGTNVIPARIDRRVLRDGYLQVLTDLHEPKAFFDRLDSLYLTGPLGRDHGRSALLRRISWRRAVEQGRLMVRAIALLSRIVIKVPDAGLRRIYLSRFRHALILRPIPSVLFIYAIRSAMHYHAWTLARDMADPDRGVVNSF